MQFNADPNAVIKAYSSEQSATTHRLMLAQAIIAGLQAEVARLTARVAELESATEPKAD